MFWWFERGGEFLHLEVLQSALDRYELRIVQPNGTEQVEWFERARDVERRQEEVFTAITQAGWMGPHGPVV
jgi:hypothetical protein